MKAFYIKVVGSNYHWCYPSNGRTYTTVEEAQEGVEADKAHVQSADRGRTVTFTVEEITDWREREQSHFNAGRYKQPKWEDDSRMDAIEDHFAHVSLQDPSLVAFTENPTKGEQDRQTSMKPGRYLKRFYPDLSAKEIIFYQEWFLSGNKPKLELSDDIELHFASTPEEIVSIYQHGPGSCMKNASSVAVYGAGDLQLAYMTRKGDIMTRCLVWPEKGVFGRIYPNVENWDDDGFTSQSECEAFRDDMQDRFVKMGWKSLQTDLKLFNGARILFRKGRDDGYVVMPYIDWVYRVEFDPKIKMFRVKHEGPISCTETSGQSYCPVERCGFCQKIEAGGGMNRFRRSYSGGDEGYACHSCVDKKKVFYCNGYGNNYQSSRVQRVDVDGAFYSLRYYKQNFIPCAATGELNLRQRMQRTGDGKFFLRHLRTDRALVFICNYDGMYYLRSDESLIYKGFPKSMDDCTIPAETRRRYHPDAELIASREREQAINAMQGLQGGVTTFGEAMRVASMSLSEMSRRYSYNETDIQWVMPDTHFGRR